jgi:arginyl-tRNA synthetase
MYVLRDLAYNIKKAQLSAGGRNIVVLGEDHKLYMEQVGSILDSMGYSPPEQVYYSYVTLKDGKMSTRRGNVVLLDEFIDLAEELATQRVQTANPAMSEQDVAAVAKDVSVAAVRFSLLRSAPSSPIVFSLDTAVRFEGATGPYLQYTAVRCRAVLAKAENFPTSEKPSISEELWAVVTMIDEYPDVLARSAERLQPNLICDYLLRLAKVVNRFYAKEQVISSGTADKRSLRVLEKVVEVLSTGLDTLGIKVPERM